MKKFEFPSYEELSKVLFLLNYIEKRGNYFCVTDFKIDIGYLFLYRTAYIEQRQYFSCNLMKFKLKKRFDKKKLLKG